MIPSTKNRATIGKTMALGLVLATLLAMLVSMAPAGAAVPSGKAFAWGDNYFGQLGNGNAPTGTNVPAAVGNLSGVKTVKAGCAHGIALIDEPDHNGFVRAWGDNSYGQLGNGNTGTDSDVPVAASIENVKAISAGCDHNLALKEDGSVWAWGDNTYGQLGNDTSGPGSYSNYPVKVANIGTGAKAIAAGEYFSLALMKDGTVRSWGRNDDGQLGNGTLTPRDTPGLVGKLSNVKAIATDSFARHALALKQDGTVRAWGNDSSGQLGDGGLVLDESKSTPVLVKNLAGVQAVATGGYHSLALLSSGRVKSWGNNYDGELGNGGHGLNTDRSAPGNVIGLDNVRTISGGAYQSFAILDSGRARSWGDNQYGELGNGNTGTESDVPVAVRNLVNVKNIDGGYAFAVASTQ